MNFTIQELIARLDYWYMVTKDEGCLKPNDERAYLQLCALLKVVEN
jgi:hypothetical protein